MELESTSAWILDLDGVVWTGTEPIDGSAAAIERLQAAGRTTLFVTNNSFSRISELEQKLAQFGVAAEGMVVSSAAAAASLVPTGSTAFVLGGPGIVEALDARGVDMVDVETAERDGVETVVVGLDWDLSYGRLSAAVLAIRAGATFVATNTDANYPSERGFLPGAGAVVAAVQTATGVVPQVAGKPNAAQARLVHETVATMEGATEDSPGSANSYFMVGDRPDTDGRFAEELGAPFGLVLSGVTGGSDLPINPVPTVVADNLWDMVDKAL